jgi:membrane associated rhomboid family serine protease
MSYPSVPEKNRSEGLATHGVRAASAVIIVGLITVGMWVLEIIDYMLGGALDSYGVTPHDVGDLGSIFTAPFAHGGFAHLIGNTVPFVVLGFLAAARGVAKFLIASLIIILVGGLGVWFLSSANTLGSSILIFGFFGYLLGRGLFERRLLDLAIAAGVVLLYGTMIFGVLPSEPGISWQGHLFGMLGGVLASWILRREKA